MVSREYRLFVVCVGSDADLLETRCKVLSTRHEVTCLSSLQQLAEEAVLDVDLVLFCHSLSMAERGVAEEIARSRWPGASLVQLSLPWQSNAGPAVMPHVSAMDGPAALLHRIPSLVPQGVGFLSEPSWTPSPGSDNPNVSG